MAWALQSMLYQPHLRRCCPSGIMWHADPLPAACCSSFTPPHPRNPADGSLFMATPVDPLFLLLPLLERSRNRVRMQDSPSWGIHVSNAVAEALLVVQQEPQQGEDAGFASREGPSLML